MYSCLKNHKTPIENKVGLKTKRCRFGAPCKQKELEQKEAGSSKDRHKFATRGRD